MNLQGKVALVTGGAKRVGRALSMALGQSGATVVVHYNTSRKDAEEVTAALTHGSRRATMFQADVSRSADIAALARHVESEHGRLDVLVNSASVFESAPVLEITEEMWDRVLATNLKGPFLLVQSLVPLMRRAGGGNIINIADLSALQAWPSYAHHGVSKAGLVHLTRILARALGPEIRVNAIAPGTVLPPEDYDGTGSDGTSDRRIVKPQGTPDDVVRAMFYLLESNFVTGQTVVVDGGRLLL